jgi:hypothetical protein
MALSPALISAYFSFCGVYFRLRSVRYWVEQSGEETYLFFPKKKKKKL